VLRRYNISCGRPNCTRLPIVMRTSNSYTLTQHTFMSLSDCFIRKGAKITVEVGLTAILIDRSRWGGFECHKYRHVTIHSKTLCTYSLLI
jgi:hypothetical protein